MRGDLGGLGQDSVGPPSPIPFDEITRAVPTLTCPGVYAYGGDHLGGDVTLRELGTTRVPELVEGMFALSTRTRPLHVSIVGGERSSATAS